MINTGSVWTTVFPFGNTTVEILQGDIIDPGRAVDIVVSTDDNYLTMGSGVSARLRAHAQSPDYVRCAQAQCPIEAGAIITTSAYELARVMGVRYVFHGAVIDYDTDARPLGDLVEQVTSRCLHKAEELGCDSILFPALATGAGRLSMEACARRMCSAVKLFLGRDRTLKHVYLILWRPDRAKGSHTCGAGDETEEFNERFIREANLVLGVPYDPGLDTVQVRDFYGRQTELEQLEAIITGRHDDGDGKRHAVILGGPATGKRSILDCLYRRATLPSDPLGAGRRLVRLTFGRVHEKTPPAFIYRKFLCALAKTENDTDQATEQLRDEFREAYSDPNLDFRGFRDFLVAHRARYPEVVFLIDRLPNLLGMEEKARVKQGPVMSPATGLESMAVEEAAGPWDFWSDLDELSQIVRFIYTAHTEEFERLRRQRLTSYAPRFQAQIEAVRLTCVTEAERTQWIDELFRRYLGRVQGAPGFVHAYYTTEAGLHPYLISLYSHALIEATKIAAFANPDKCVDFSEPHFRPIFHRVDSAVARPRREFFEHLVALATPAEIECLRSLAEAEAIDCERNDLIPEAVAGDAGAHARLATLQREGDPRLRLDRKTLHQLVDRGYLIVDDEETAHCMAPSFAHWLAKYFGLRHGADHGGRPRTWEITLLNIAEPPAPQIVRTMVRGQGARVPTTKKELNPDTKRDFLENLSKCLTHLLHPGLEADPGWWQEIDQVAGYILNQFATGDIKRCLQNPPIGTTITLEIDEALKSIPWELMLEATYAGEIPFCVGRTVIGRESSTIDDVIRTPRALLIGDPTDDLPAARAEVEELAWRLRKEGSFRVEPDDLFIGSSRCQTGPLIGALGSHTYGLVHYSGHTLYDGYHSAWQLAEGKRILTYELTSALQMGPPALVFSSSCESGVGGEVQPIKYEDQTFDLPSAFLQAGVETYIGTLWAIEEEAARRFVARFYDAFLTGEFPLGECLRRAKWAGKRDERYDDRINWLAFMLYGDPRLMPHDLYPASHVHV